MASRADQVFAIHRRVRSVWFQIGYCESWEIKHRRYFLHEPFSRRVIITLGGEMFFRGPWVLPPSVSLEHHSIEPMSRELWMLLTYEDLTESLRVLSESIASFHQGGFNRLGGS